MRAGLRVAPTLACRACLLLPRSCAMRCLICNAALLGCVFEVRTVSATDRAKAEDIAAHEGLLGADITCAPSKEHPPWPPPSPDVTAWTTCSPDETKSGKVLCARGNAFRASARCSISADACAFMHWTMPLTRIWTCLRVIVCCNCTTPRWSGESTSQRLLLRQPRPPPPHHPHPQTQPPRRRLLRRSRWG